MPIEGILTAINILSQKIIRPFINLMKKKVHSNYIILNKGYNSDINHLEIKEQGRTVILIVINRRKGKIKMIQK